MLTVYFDTNAFDGLQRCSRSECSLSLTLRSAIALKRLRVVIGLQVLDETVAAYPSRPDIVSDRLDLIEAIADPHEIVALAPELLRQDVVAIISGSPFASPFTHWPVDLVALRRALRDPHCDLQRLLGPNRRIFRANADILRACRSDLRQQLEKRDWPRVDFTRILAEGDWFLQSLVDSLLSPGTLPSPILRGLLRSRPVRMYQGTFLSLIYSQAVENRAPRDSDLLDLHHAVCASVTDGLVTEDAGLARCVRRVPIEPFGVWSLADLSGKMRAV